MVSVLSSAALGSNLRHTFSTVMIYSPKTLGENLGIMVELGPLASREFCASVSSVEDRFMTHLAVMLGANVPGMGDVAPIVDVVVVALVVVELLGFDSPLIYYHACIHQTTA